MKTQALLSALLAPLVLAPATAQEINRLVSQTPGGTSGSGASGWTQAMSLSADGRFVAFDSHADDLVGSDAVGIDAFVRDTLLGVTEHVAVSTAGAAANHGSAQPSISDDGRYVAFTSSATNLHPGVPPLSVQLYVRDRQAGTTTLISSGLGGNGAHGWCEDPIISADGEWILFSSSADDLVPGDTNFVRDMFLAERATGAIQRVSVGDAGQQCPQSTDQGSITADGRYALWVSFWDPMIAGDANGAPDLLLFDRTTGTSSLITVPGGFLPGDIVVDPAISDDGQTIAFVTGATGLVPGDDNPHQDVYVLDVPAGTLELASRSTSKILSDRDSQHPELSADGRWVLFESKATTLSKADDKLFFDVYAHDRQSGDTLRVSLNEYGQAPLDHSYNSGISANGRFVAFSSNADSLTGGDANGDKDVFLHDLSVAPPQAYCSGRESSQDCDPRIGWAGSTSISSGLPFRLLGNEIVPANLGFVFYGSQSQAIMFQGGTLCVAAPTVRTPAQVSGTPDQSPCTGTFDLDFSAWYLSGADPALALGVPIYAQYWYRDPNAYGFATGLTDALRFVLRP